MSCLDANPKWPLRRQFMYVFMLCCSIASGAVLFLVLTTNLVIGGNTNTLASRGVTVQIQKQINSSSSETGQIIGQRFQTLEKSVLNPLVVATQQVYYPQLERWWGANNSGPIYPIKQETLSAGSEYWRDTKQSPDIFSAAYNDRSGEYVNTAHSVWYYSSSNTYTATLSSAKIDHVVKSSLLDSTFKKLYELHDEVLGLYVGFELESDNRAAWRYYPGKRLVKSNTLFACVPSCYNPKARGWYTDAVAARGETIISEPYQGASGKKFWMVTLAKALYHGPPGSSPANGATLFGVIGIDIKLETIQQSILSINFLQTGYASLCQSDGRVIADKNWANAPSNGDFIWQHTEGLTESHWTEVVSTLRGGESNVIEYGGTHYASFTKINPLQNSDLTYIVVVHAPIPEVNAPLAAMRARIDATVWASIAWAAVMLLLTEIIMRCILRSRARHISLPLEIMANMADSILSNASKKNIFEDIDTQKLMKPGVVENNEIGQLAKEFVMMIQGGGRGRRKSIGEAKGIADSDFQENPITTNDKGEQVKFSMNDGLPWNADIKATAPNMGNDSSSSSSTSSSRMSSESVIW